MTTSVRKTIALPDASALETMKSLGITLFDEALQVAADFIDLKSPYRAGHSRSLRPACSA